VKAHRTLAHLIFIASVYSLAWLGSFLLVVGPRWDLIPYYFVLGWTFSGLELVSFVWLSSVVVTIAVVAAWVIWIRVQGKQPRESVV
jgi:hypothetical protein